MLSVSAEIKVLIATDGSEEIYSASRLVAALVRSSAVDRFIILTVTWPPHEAPIWDDATMRLALVDDLHHAVAIAATEAMERIAHELRPLGVPVDYVLKAGDPAQQILAVARAHNVELIVIGRHPQHASPGSISNRILAEAQCPVLIGSPGAVGRDARRGS